MHTENVFLDCIIKLLNFNLILMLEYCIMCNDQSPEGIKSIENTSLLSFLLLPTTLLNFWD